MLRILGGNGFFVLGFIYWTWMKLFLLLSQIDSMFFYTHRYTHEMASWTIEVKSTLHVSLSKNQKPLYLYIKIKTSQPMRKKIIFKQYHTWGMIANIFHFIVICYTPLNQEYLSKVTVIIMFLVIKETTRKTEPGSP